MLDAALSPLISALPQYERSFLDHLSIGQAFHGAMQVTCCSCRDVVSYDQARAAHRILTALHLVHVILQCTFTCHQCAQDCRLQQ